MAQRSRVISLGVIVLIVLISVAMYVAIGNQGGFTGVPRLIPLEFLPKGVGGGTSEDPLVAVGWGLLIVVTIAVFGFTLYKLRRVTD